MTAYTLGLVVSTVAILGTACNRTEEIAPAVNSDGSVTAKRPPGQPDAWLTTQVQARYFADATLRGSDVDVSTNAGVVTLSGSVPTETARAHAVALAKQVEGVTGVESTLSVATGSEREGTQAAGGDGAPKPPAQPSQSASTASREPSSTAGERFDAAWTTTKIQAQYFVDPGVKGRNIDVTTQTDGTVTLRGRVESDAARQKALRIAKGTEGVRQVVDELRIDTTVRAPAQATPQASDVVEDGWITAKIQSKYFLDAEVKGRAIDVDTRNGVVTLSGTLATPAERRQAVAIARQTEGVRSVNDQLTVQTTTAVGELPTSGKRLERAAGGAETTPSDEWIVTTIQSKFFLSDEVRSGDVSVKASGGVVTLGGRVDAEETKKTAETIARETRGVQGVVNQLTVEAAGTP